MKGPDGIAAAGFRWIGTAALIVSVSATMMWAVWGNRLSDHRPGADEVYVDGIAVSADALIDAGLQLDAALHCYVAFSVVTSFCDAYRKSWGRVDLERRPWKPGAGATTMKRVSIGEQKVVAGAPLVIFEERSSGRKIRACIAKVGEVDD